MERLKFLPPLETDYPIPDKSEVKTTPGRYPKYGFEDMKIGDSFNASDEPFHKKNRDNVKHAADQFLKRKKLEWKFVFKIVYNDPTDKSKGGHFRVWREK